MGKRYIDAEELDKKLHEEKSANLFFIGGIARARVIAREIPTADVVEMPVRCKDCIYCEQLTIPNLEGVLFNCRYFLKTVGKYGDGFCSWGVKYSQAEGKEVRNDDE